MNFIKLTDSDVLQPGDCIKFVQFDKLTRLSRLQGERIGPLRPYLDADFEGFYRPTNPLPDDRNNGIL